MNRSLALDRTLLVDIFTTVDEVNQIFIISGLGGLIKTLKNASSEFILTNFKWRLSVSLRGSISSFLDKQSGRFEVTEIRTDVQWSMVIHILDFQYLLQKSSGLSLKLFDNVFIVDWIEEVFELVKHVFVLSWIESSLFFSVQVLNLLEEVNKVKSLSHDLINIYRKHGIESLVALSEFAHGSVVKRSPLIHILLNQDLTIPVDDITGILSEKILYFDDESLETLHQILILVKRAGECTVLNVHILESGVVFLPKNLIIQSLLEVSPFKAQNGDETFKMPAINHIMVHVAAIIIHVNFLLADVFRSAHF